MKWWIWLVILSAVSVEGQVWNPTNGGVAATVPVLSSGPLFEQQQILPVLAKGTTYDGWQADAIAAPSVAWDGARYVMGVSLWNIANAQWASAFFTSTNLLSWSYVSGSLFVPTGGSYIVGDGSISFFGGKYWYAYDSGPTQGGGTIKLANSTNLTTWTVVNTNLASGYGVSTQINPSNSKLEVWYAADAVISMYDSPDGTTWTNEGAFYILPPFPGGGSAGSPAVFYLNGTRVAMSDESPNPFNSGRYIYGAYQPSAGALVWNGLNAALINNPGIPWQSAQVFDPFVIVTDTGDGLGSIARMLFTGGDNVSGVDDTNSSIGLANATGLLYQDIFTGYASPILPAVVTVGTTPIAANTCTTAQTVNMPMLNQNDSFTFTPTVDVSAVTGWGQSGGLIVEPWPTYNTLNYKVCNQTGSSITPGGSATFNVGAR